MSNISNNLIYENIIEYLSDKNIINDIEKIFIKNNYLTREEGNSNTIIESVSMYYFCKINNIDEKIKTIVEKIYQLCLENLEKRKCPCVYIFNINNSILAAHNSQHYLWASKMFYSYYQYTNENKYYEIAKNIIDWLLNNMIIDDEYGKRFINWKYEKKHNLNNRTSIKTFSAADILLHLGYSDVYESQLNFMYNNMYDNGIFYRDYNNKNKKNIEETKLMPHDNLEVVECLYESYLFTKNEIYRNMASDLLKNIIKICNFGKNNLAIFQCYKWAYILNIEYTNERIKNILENYNNGLSAYSTHKKKNIFAYIYLYRIINKEYSVMYKL